MTRYLFFLYLAIFFSSCKTYQTYELQLDRKSVNEDALLLSQDSVQVEVIFSKKDLVFDLKVSNHKDLPINIDWEKTKLVVGEKIVPIKNQNQRIVLWGTYGSDFDLYQIIDMEGVIVEPKSSSFLPPQTTIVVRVNHLKNTIQFSENKHKDKEVFTSKETPFQFRIYLTYEDDDATGKMRYIDMPLYVSSKIQVKKFPGDQLSKREFYVENKNSSGGVIFGSAVLIVVMFSILSFS